MDIMGADFFNAIDMMRERLKTNPVPIQLPIGKEEDFKGIVDLIEMNAIVYDDELGKELERIAIPEDMKELADEYREKLIESVAEHNDKLLEKYFEGEEIEKGELIAAIREATIALDIVPVTCGSSYRNKGVQPLLDCIVDFLPSPLDIPPVVGKNEDDEDEVRKADDSEPFSALAFKIMSDPFVGKLAFVRVYSGTLNAGSTIYNSTKGKRERVGRLLRMHANTREDIEALYAGDIAAVVGPKAITTGDTLCDDKHTVVLETMDFPEPVIEVAIEPKTKAGQEKMGMALARLAEEDPTFRTYTDTETGQTIIAGMGELHLEIIVDRMMREYKVEAKVGKPQVSYRETIRKAVKTTGLYKKQSGGKGQYGHVVIELEPQEPGAGYEFVDKEYIPAVDEGIREAAKNGVLAGFEVMDFRATLVDGSYHEVDSSEIAFKIAGSMAFKDAVRSASPVLLEPIMSVEVHVPDDYLGDVMGNLNSRRGQIEGTEIRAGAQVIRSLVPLSEMFGYATDLRSRTQGRGTFTMQFAHYKEVPKSIAEKVVGS
jgi:elongation factor G